MKSEPLDLGGNISIEIDSGIFSQTVRVRIKSDCVVYSGESDTLTDAIRELLIEVAGAAAEDEAEAWKSAVKDVADDFHPDSPAESALALQEMREALSELTA
jgi:hypothetical protein